MIDTSFKKTIGLFALLTLLASGCGDSTKGTVLIELPANFATESEFEQVITIWVEGEGMDAIHESFPYTSTEPQTLELIVDVGPARKFTLIVLRNRDFDPFPSLEVNDTLQSALFGAAVSDIVAEETNVVPIALLPKNYADDASEGAAVDVGTIEVLTQRGAPFCGQLPENGDSVLILAGLNSGVTSGFDAVIGFNTDSDANTGNSSLLDTLLPAADPGSLSGFERAIHMSVNSGQPLAELVDLTNGNAVLLSAQGGWFAAHL